MGLPAPDKPLHEPAQRRSTGWAGKPTQRHSSLPRLLTAFKIPGSPEGPQSHQTPSLSHLLVSPSPPPLPRPSTSPLVSAITPLVTCSLTSVVPGKSAFALPSRSSRQHHACPASRWKSSLGSSWGGAVGGGGGCSQGDCSSGQSNGLRWHFSVGWEELKRGFWG